MYDKINKNPNPGSSYIQIYTPKIHNQQDNIKKIKKKKTRL